MVAPTVLKSARVLSPLPDNLKFGVILLGLMGMMMIDRPASAAPVPPDTSPPGGHPPVVSDGIPVFLLVTLNGNVAPELASFTERQGQLYMTAQVARQLGFKTDYLARISPAMPLSAYPGIQVDYNQSRQSLTITAPFALLDLDTKILGANSAVRTEATVSPGLLLNYDLYSSYGPDSAGSVSAFSELRFFNGWGTASSTWLSQAAKPTARSDWDRTTIRMDSRLQHSWQDQGVTLRLGDTLTQALPWTRQTRIGGVRFSRDFSLQPYQVTTPLPAYFGTAATPSSVQLYIDGIRQYTGQVPAGPFQLNFQPSVSGAGQAQVVLTDALGRSVPVLFPFYVANQLLRPGLTDWSFEAGYVRQNYGYLSFDYAKQPMAAGTLRYGLTRSLTLNTHLEAGDRIVMGGAGADVLIGDWGTLSGSWAGSHADSYVDGRVDDFVGGYPDNSADNLTDNSTDNLAGHQFALGYQLRRGIFSLGVRTQQADNGFRDVASRYGALPIQRSDSAYAGVSVGQWGNFGVNYVRLKQSGNQDDSRYAGLSWSRALPLGMMFSLSGNQNLNDSSDRSIMFSLTVNLDSGLSGHVSTTHGRDADSYAVSVSNRGDQFDSWNWNLQAQRSISRQDAGSESSSLSGEIDRHTQYADINLGANRFDDRTNLYAGAAGSVVAMGGGVFASRRIYDAFAVVSTDSIPDIPVFSENRPVGSTNDQGLLLVPSLRSYQDNKIAIDPTQLPVDMHIDQVRMNVVPQGDSGVEVTFKMRRVNAASLILRLADGQPVPLGTVAYLNGNDKPAGWVGYDGRLYLEGLKSDNRVELRGDQLDCHVQFAFQRRADTLPEIGPLSCVR